MNDPNVATGQLQQIISASRPHELSLAERCALFAAMRELTDDLRAHIADELGHDGYAQEKVAQVRWHTAAALGFDVNNKHDDSQHRSWALGALDSLLSRFPN